MDYKEFKQIDGTNYEVNRLGEIRRIPSDYYKSKPVILKTWKNNNGYDMVALSHHSKLTRRTVHRLVAQTFLEDYSDDLAVNHKDGNKSNNCVDNLEMVTWGENTQHALRTGLIKPMSAESRQRVADAHKKPYYVYKDGELVYEAICGKDAAEYIGCTVQTVYSCSSKGTRVFGYTVSRTKL